MTKRKNTTFGSMGLDQTNTYQYAKEIFNTLGVKDDTEIQIPEQNVKVFRKHLSEMIKRQQSSNRYASRYTDNKLKIIRIQ